MSTPWSSVFTRAALLTLSALWAACQSDPMAPKTTEAATTAALKSVSSNAAGNVNGAAGQMPAFYDGQQFIVNMKELPEEASAATIAHNGSINEI